MPTEPTQHDLQNLQSALLAAFDHDALIELPYLHFKLKLEWMTPVVGKRDLTTVVGELVRYFASGEDGIKELLDAAIKENAGNERLQSLQQDWATRTFAPIELEVDHPAVQAGDRGFAAGRDVNKSNVITGDNSSISSSVTNVTGGQHIYYGTEAPPSDEPEEPAPGDPPYMGLNYFTQKEAHLFFGRTALTEELVAQLSAINGSTSRFLAVIGASGSGKSSLVRAGLLPALAEGKIDGSDRWAVYVMTPKAAPLESLALSLTKENESVTAAETLRQDLAQTANSLHLYTRRLMTERAANERLLLVVDQFEELFTLCKDKTERQHFIDNLMAAAKTTGPTVVVLTLRADFYAHCAGYDDLRLALETQQKFIGAMSEDELRQTIVEPAEGNGWTFEPGLAELILDDVGREPGALPLLSHALRETWERRSGHTLTLAGYYEVGRVQGAIAKTADRIFEGLAPEEQTIARSIFLRLTELGEGAEDTRRRVKLSELLPTDGDLAQVEEVLKQLADARLVITHETEAEVAHEALIREWETLRGWLDADRDDLRLHRRLTEEAQEWEKGQDDSLLYRGGRLEQAQAWARQYSDAMNPLEVDFLTASQDAVEAEEQQREADRQENEKERNKKRVYVMTSAGFLGGALVGAAEAFWILGHIPGWREVITYSATAIIFGLFGMAVAFTIGFSWYVTTRWLNSGTIAIPIISSAIVLVMIVGVFVLAGFGAKDQNTLTNLIMSGIMGLFIATIVTIEKRHILISLVGIAIITFLIMTYAPLAGRLSFLDPETLQHVIVYSLTLAASIKIGYKYS